MAASDEAISLWKKRFAVFPEKLRKVVSIFLNEAERGMKDPSPREVVERAFELAQEAARGEDRRMARYGRAFLVLRNSPQEVEKLVRAAEAVIQVSLEEKRIMEEKRKRVSQEGKEEQKQEDPKDTNLPPLEGAEGESGQIQDSSLSFPAPGPLRPTPEQEEAVQAFLGGGDLKLVAVAGSGKTTTLQMMAERAGNRRLLYMAFNKSVEREAKARFPRNTQVSTLHSYAYNKVVDKAYREKANRGAKGLPITALEELLDSQFKRDFPTAADRRSRYYAVRDMVKRFLTTTAPEPGPEHIPPSFRDARRLKEGWPQEEALLVEAARLVWRKMQEPRDPFPLTHDGYVRMWYDAGGEVSGFDAVLVDEAQDLNPVFLEVLNRSPLQKVYVGDPRQQIYAWRGAVNAMARISAPEVRLTQSFRFGEELARGVRAITRFFGEEVPVVGTASLRTEVRVTDGGWPHPPFAVLARTNAGVVDALMKLWTNGILPVHVVGGVNDLVWLLEDAHALRWGLERERPYPELAGFSTWEELKALAQEGLDPLIERVLRLAERYPDLASLADTVRKAHVDEEKEAKAVLSTAHKAKGREWDRVILWDDYPAVWEDYVRQAYLKAGKEGELKEQENLLYVAMTRARELLIFSYELEKLYYIGWKSGPVDPVKEFLETLLQDPRVPQDIKDRAIRLLGK